MSVNANGNSIAVGMAHPMHTKAVVVLSVGDGWGGALGSLNRQETVDLVAALLGCLSETDGKTYTVTEYRA